MKLSQFDYYLPPNLIAQKQIKPRDHSRLLVLDRSVSPPESPNKWLQQMDGYSAGVSSERLQRERKRPQWGMITHDYFYNLDKYLTKNDVLVFNNSKVIPARIRLDNGGEIFLLKDLKYGQWEVIGRKLRNSPYEIPDEKSGCHIATISQTEEIKKLRKGLRCEIVKRLDNGNWVVKFNYTGKKFSDILEKIGETPLPPYIKTKDSNRIRQDYQTLYAKHKGSVAAPTAGLHFTPRVFKKLKKKGIKTEFVTLHVGLGTFQPVKTDEIECHHMHAEYATLNFATAKRLNNYRKQGKRIIAVGTTSCRVLESFSNQKNQLKAGSKWVDIFIYPPYKFKFVDSIITNFHLPKSTLLMLVSALAGRKFILQAYQEAIKRKYQFYSFGDGMLIK